MPTDTTFALLPLALDEDFDGGGGENDDSAAAFMSSCVVLGRSTSSIGEEDSSWEGVGVEVGGEIIKRWTSSSTWSSTTSRWAGASLRMAVPATRVGKRGSGAASASGARQRELRRRVAFIVSG